MTYFAQYDPSAITPAKIIGWYNTGARSYPNLPSASNLLEISEAEWQAHYANPDGWAVAGGALVAFTPPAPVLTLAQQAANAAVAGLTVALSGTMTLAATLFPTDATTQQKLVAVSATLLETGDFPGGGTTYPMVDSSGAWYTFTASQYKAVAGAIAAYVAACDLIAAGNPRGATALPANTVSITV